MIVNTLLSALFSSGNYKPHISPWEAPDKRLCSCGAWLGDLAQWFHRADSLIPSQPHESKVTGADSARLPGISLSSRHILLSTRPHTCWPEKPPFCSLFHNILMKCGSKGHQPRVTQPPTPAALRN